jgi:hypothetical protein
VRSIALLCVLLSGCALGKNVNSVPAAVTASGAQGRLEVERSILTVELLTVDNSSVIMLDAQQKVISLPLARIRRFEFKPFVVDDGPPDEHQRGVLRRISRFPFGIPDAALAALLARSGQASIESVP